MFPQHVPTTECKSTGLVRAKKYMAEVNGIQCTLWQTKQNRIDMWMYKLIGLPACHPGTQYQRSCCCPLCQLGFLCPQMPSAPNNHPITPVLQKLKRYDNNPIDWISHKKIEKRPFAFNNHVILQKLEKPSVLNILHKKNRWYSFVGFLNTFCWEN